MNMKLKLISLIIGAFFLFSACSIGSNNNQPPLQNALTSAAQTVSVQLTNDKSTEIANGAPATPLDNALSATETPIVIIATAIPSSTPVPINTATQVPTSVACDNMRFVADVTIEDGTDFSPGEGFTKTWRIKNIGSCSWTSEYDLVFYGGDAMGGPANQQLTAVDVAPGVTIDISVDLVSPVDEERYKGEWILRNNAGILFGMSGEIPFWVEIEVVESVATVEPTATNGLIITPIVLPTLVVPDPSP